MAGLTDSIKMRVVRRFNPTVDGEAKTTITTTTLISVVSMFQDDAPVQQQQRQRLVFNATSPLYVSCRLKQASLDDRSFITPMSR